MIPTRLERVAAIEQNMQSEHTGEPSEPGVSFNHAIHKCMWAARLIAQLKDEVAKFSSSQEATDNRLYYNKDTTSITVRKVAVPANIPLLAGDAIFSLRSALDCCWMGMKRSADRSASKATLPRAETKAQLISTLRKASLEAYFPGSNQFIIDTLQPFYGGNDFLWRCGQVDNWNKHNMLPLSVGMTKIEYAYFISEKGRTAEFKNVDVYGNWDEGPFIMADAGDDNFVLQPGLKISTTIAIELGKPPLKVPVDYFAEGVHFHTVKAIERFIDRFHSGAAIYAWDVQF